MDDSREILINLGTNIRTVRLSKGLQQKEVAAMTGISATQFGRIENGATKASVLIISKIAKALDVGIDLLVFGEQAASKKDHITLKDKELIEKMKELDELNENEKQIAHELLDLILTKKKLKDITDNLHKSYKK